MPYNTAANIVHSVFVLFFDSVSPLDTCLACSSGSRSSSSMETSTFRSFGNKAGHVTLLWLASLLWRVVTSLNQGLRHQATKRDGCSHVKNRNLSLRRRSNLTTNLPSSCFAFSSRILSPSRTRTLPRFRFLITRDFTVVGSIPSGTLIIFLNSLFSNPSSPSDRCWPCKIIFSPSTSSEMSSVLYCFSGREAILIGPWTANLFWLRWKLVSRACSS